jgi:hypothetical protein
VGLLPPRALSRNHAVVVSRGAAECAERGAGHEPCNLGNRSANGNWPACLPKVHSPRPPRLRVNLVPFSTAWTRLGGEGNVAVHTWVHSPLQGAGGFCGCRRGVSPRAFTICPVRARVPWWPPRFRVRTRTQPAGRYSYSASIQARPKLAEPSLRVRVPVPVRVRVRPLPSAPRCLCGRITSQTSKGKRDKA